MWMEQLNLEKVLGMTAFLLSMTFLFGLTLSPTSSVSASSSIIITTRRQSWYHRHGW